MTKKELLIRLEGVDDGATVLIGLSSGKESWAAFTPADEFLCDDVEGYCGYVTPTSNVLLTTLDDVYDLLKQQDRDRFDREAREWVRDNR